MTVDRGRFTLLVDGADRDGDEGAAAGPQGRGRRRPGRGSSATCPATTGALARIVEVTDRGTVLRRTADDDDPVERVIVANADQLVVVTALADPEPQPRLVDRALVAAYDAGMSPLLCLTKADLADPDDVPVDATGSLGRALGGHPAGRRPRRAARAAHGRVSVLVGSSGVGKSTLVNALRPERDARGRHRQRGDRPRPAHVDVGVHAGAARRHEGWIIDTPGIRSFGLAHVAARGPDRGVPRPRRDDRGLPARLHPRRRRARVRARRGGRVRQADPDRVASFRRLLAARSGPEY